MLNWRTKMIKAKKKEVKKDMPVKTGDQSVPPKTSKYGRTQGKDFVDPKGVNGKQSTPPVTSGEQQANTQADGPFVAPESAPLEVNRDMLTPNGSFQEALAKCHKRKADLQPSEKKHVEEKQKSDYEKGKSNE